MCLLGLKFKVFFLEICIFSPVFGFLPILSFLSVVLNVPKPLISTLPPEDNVSPIRLIVFCNIFSISLEGRCLNFFQEDQLNQIYS